MKKYFVGILNLWIALPTKYTKNNLCTVKPVFSSHTREAQKWLLKAGGCLTEVNISTKLMIGNSLFGFLRQVGCLIEVTANTGLAS